MIAVTITKYIRIRLFSVVIKYLFRTIHITRSTAFYCVRQYFHASFTVVSLTLSLFLSLCDRLLSLAEYFSRFVSRENVPSYTHSFARPPEGFKRKNSYEKCIENDWLGTFFPNFIFSFFFYFFVLNIE